MPYKTGLAQKRKELLQKELNRIVPEIIRTGVEKLILFGSLATDSVGKASDIDLIIIKQGHERFLDRLEFFYQYLKPSVSTDILVYTPQEFERMKDSSHFIRTALKQGKILYEKQKYRRSWKMV